MPSWFHGVIPYLVVTSIILALIRLEVILVRDIDRRKSNVFEAEKVLEYKLIGALLASRVLLEQIEKFIPFAAVSALGGGLIRLRSDGLWLVPSFVAFFIVFDFWAYFIHRLQHRFAILWSMHSLHHSAEAMSVTTGARHYWFESLVGTVLSLPLAFVLRVPLEFVPIVAALHQLVGGLTHFDLHVSFGKASVLLNNPHWHRIHHSNRPEHRDKNFANIFPIFDLIFGTAWYPAPNEFPNPGLDTGDKPASVFEGMIWPVRNLWRGWRDNRNRRRIDTDTPSPIPTN